MTLILECVIPQYSAPSQSVDTVVYSFSGTPNRCSASFRLVYFTPKSSTTRVNCIGREMCVHSPSVCLPHNIQVVIFSFVGNHLLAFQTGVVHKCFF